MHPSDIQIKEIPALGTFWWFDLFDTPQSREQEVTDCIIDHLTNFEQQYSRFLDTSLVGKLNRTGTLLHPSGEFVSLLQFGQQLYRETNGTFNFLSAHTQIARGYGPASGIHDETGDTTPADPTIDLALSSKKVTLRRGAVDLGGFGKGWLIDKIARALHTSLGIQHFLINGGGDIYASTFPDGSPIDIFVEHPTEKKHIIAKIPLTNQGFAGSGTHKRHWQHNGTHHHHIIAQHTAETAAHIVAKTALHADVFATIACAVTPSAAPDILKNNNLEYLLVHNDSIAYSEQMTQHLL